MVRPQQQQAGNRPPSPPSPPQPPQKAAAPQEGDAAQDLKDQVGETAGQAAAQVKQSTQSLLGSQKDRATQSLKALADTMDQASHQLEQSEGGGFFASSISRAAASVQQLSGRLDEREVHELVSDLEQFARTRPAVFLSGTFALGVLGARFLRSSGQRQSESETGSSDHGAPALPSRPAGSAGTPPRRENTGPPRRPATPPVGGPGRAPQPGGGRPRQFTPASTGVNHPASGPRGTAPSPPAQPNPLLPPDLDPRPGQHGPNPSRQ